MNIVFKRNHDTYANIFWKEKVWFMQNHGYVCGCGIALCIRNQFPSQLEPPNMCLKLIKAN